jgi:hypothetical protein
MGHMTHSANLIKPDVTPACTTVWKLFSANDDDLMVVAVVEMNHVVNTTCMRPLPGSTFRKITIRILEHYLPHRPKWSILGLLGERRDGGSARIASYDTTTLNSMFHSEPWLSRFMTNCLTEHRIKHHPPEVKTGLASQRLLLGISGLGSP